MSPGKDVTQYRRLFLETETKTFNVGGSPGADQTAAADPPGSRAETDPGPECTQTCNDDEPDRSGTVSGDGAAATAPRPFDRRRERARRIVERLEASGRFRFKLDDRGAIRFELNPGRTLEDDGPDDAERSEVREYSAEIAALLSDRSAPTLTTDQGRTGPPARGPRPIPMELQSRVRDRIGRLLRNPDPGASDQAAAALAAAFADDQDPGRSLETYRGLAEDCRTGELPTALLIDAFNYSCKKGINRSRGASYIWFIKSKKSQYMNI